MIDTKLNTRRLYRAVLAGGIGSAVLMVSIFWTHPNQGLTARGAWNAKAAAEYLDSREQWWSQWPVSARDHGTFCISCHTVVSYALARPALQKALNEQAPAIEDAALLEDVSKRVRLWKDSGPYYSDSVGANKSAQSRGTESVLNALVLVNADASPGRLSEMSQAALSNMWSMQVRSGEERGAWPWLDFGNEPFEAKGSVYYGASLGAVAVGLTPPQYRTRPDVRESVQLLRDYLRSRSSRQPLIHRVVTLWAATRWPELLSPAERQSIIDNILDSENPDGGWGLSGVGWTWRGMNLHSFLTLWVRSNDSPVERRSDGYATGLIVFVLRQTGLSLNDSHVKRGRSWLLTNQDQKGGEWPGYSMVNRRSPTSGTGRFMTDAATAYAVLALTSTDRP